MCEESPKNLNEPHSQVISPEVHCRSCLGFWGWPVFGGWCREHEVYVSGWYSCPDWTLRSFNIPEETEPGEEEPDEAE